jgi:hypothetical protein
VDPEEIEKQLDVEPITKESVKKNAKKLEDQKNVIVEQLQSENVDLNELIKQPDAENMK